jgi:hypothetical protein
MSRSNEGGCTKLIGRQTERIQEFLPVFALEDDDFAASTTDVGIDVEHLPEMINGAGTRYETNVQEDANVGLKNRAKCVEEPAMGIDPLLRVLLQAKDDLHGDNTSLCTFYLVRRGKGDCREHKTAGKTNHRVTHSE